MGMVSVGSEQNQLYLGDQQTRGSVINSVIVKPPVSFNLSDTGERDGSETSTVIMQDRYFDAVHSNRTESDELSEDNTATESSTVEEASKSSGELAVLEQFQLDSMVFSETLVRMSDMLAAALSYT